VEREAQGESPASPPVSVARPVPLALAIASLVVRDSGLSPRGQPIEEEVVYVVQPTETGAGAGDWSLASLIRYMATFGVYRCDEQHRLRGSRGGFHLYVPHSRGPCYLESSRPEEIDL
jgi:hypothetical protein